MSLFFSFSVAQVLVGLRKPFINNFVFPTWACAACLDNNNSVRTAIENIGGTHARVLSTIPGHGNSKNEK